MGLCGLHTPSLNQTGIQVSSLLKLLQADPFVIRVSLSYVSGAKDDDIVKFREAGTVGAISHRLRCVSPRQFK